jgi:hypothetical protein
MDRWSFGSPKEGKTQLGVKGGMDGWKADSKGGRGELAAKGTVGFGLKGEGRIRVCGI